MEWHINELSLDRQFADSQAFRAFLEPLLRLRLHEPILRNRLFCSRLLCTWQVTATQNLREAVTVSRDNNYMRLVLEWMAKAGPFWDDERQPNDDDYFLYQTHDVTDLGLGEAARRKLIGTDACTFSFHGSRLPFTTTPLRVQQGLPEAPIAGIDIHNLWDVTQLATAAQSCRVYDSWRDVQQEIMRRFAGLLFSEHVVAALLPTPFSELVTKRIFELLHVLNRIVLESDDSGRLSQDGMELLRNHFAGDKAWFTDESERNKLKFEQEMTFADPSNRAHRIFCPWHGKIKTPQIRIHFEWPRPAGQRMIKIVFIGPKITKG